MSRNCVVPANTIFSNRGVLIGLPFADLANALEAWSSAIAKRSEASVPTHCGCLAATEIAAFEQLGWSNCALILPEVATHFRFEQEKAPDDAGAFQIAQIRRDQYFGPTPDQLKR